MTDSQSEIVIPAATTIGELNTHIGYMRVEISKANNAIAAISQKIDDLDDHYITEQEFRPIAEKVAALDIKVDSNTKWQDTANGKLIGFGVGISVATSLLTLALTYFLK